MPHALSLLSSSRRRVPRVSERRRRGPGLRRQGHSCARTRPSRRRAPRASRYLFTHDYWQPHGDRRPLPAAHHDVASSIDRALGYGDVAFGYVVENVRAPCDLRDARLRARLAGGATAAERGDGRGAPLRGPSDHDRGGDATSSGARICWRRPACSAASLCWVRGRAPGAPPGPLASRPRARRRCWRSSARRAGSSLVAAVVLWDVAFPRPTDVRSAPSTSSSSSSWSRIWRRAGGSTGSGCRRGTSRRWTTRSSRSPFLAGTADGARRARPPGGAARLAGDVEHRLLVPPDPDRRGPARASLLRDRRRSSAWRSPCGRFWRVRSRRPAILLPGRVRPRRRPADRQTCCG